MKRNLSYMAYSILIATMVLMLGACGGSGGGASTPPPPPTDADPTGYYDVTVTGSISDGMGGTMMVSDFQAIVHNNRFMMMSVAKGLLYDGTITNISQNSFTATVIIYTNGANPISAAISGTITEGSKIEGTLIGTGAGSGSFEINYAGTNNQTAALAKVENTTNATWGAIVGGSATDYEIIINNAGNVVDDVNNVGGVFDTCLISFVMSTISPIANSNLYSVSASIGSCTNSNVDNTSYSGLATTRSAVNPDDTLVFMLTSGNHGFYGDFQ